jgi:hypothetical protein
MYSYEDRIRAVKLYIKLGKRIGATLRQLGYPTKNALKGWHREFEQRQDLPAASVRSWQKYSDEQKRISVEHFLNHDHFKKGRRAAMGRLQTPASSRLCSAKRTMRLWHQPVPQALSGLSGCAIASQVCSDCRPSQLISEPKFSTTCRTE